MTSPAAIAQAAYQLPSRAFDEPALVNPGQEPGELAGPELDASGLPTKGTPRLMAALAELDGAQEAYDLAREMYDGQFGDMPISSTMQKLLSKHAVSEINDLCYARVPVDTIAEKETIRAIVAIPAEDLDDLPELAPGDEGGDEEEDGPTPQQQRQVKRAQQALARIRKHNQLDIEEVELIMRRCEFGDAYMEVWPSREVPPDPTDDDQYDGTQRLEPTDPGPADTVDIHVLGPDCVRAFYDLEQPLRVTHYIKRWEMRDPYDSEAPTQYRANIYDSEGVERWICDPDGDRSRPEDWKPYSEDGDPSWPLPYPAGVDRIPFFHLRNNRPYGTPEHEPAYGAQILINKLVSAHAVTIDFTVFPQRYMLLDPKADHTLINLNDPDNPDDDGDDPEGDGHSQLRADPSAVWRLYAQSVGQFQPADPGSFLQPLDRYIRSISELTGIPLDRFVGYSTPPSGQSRRIGNEVLYEKVNARRRRDGGVIADAYEFALQLMGIDGVQVMVKWAPLEVAAGVEDWNVVQAKINAGVPVRTALVEAGYDEEEVDLWLLSQDGADLNRRVDLLNKVGTAVQALAAGVGVGLVSQEQAGDLVARIMGQVRDQLPDTDKPVELKVPPTPPPGMPPGAQKPPPGKPGEDKPGAPPAAAPALPPMPPPPPPIQVGVSKEQ